MNATDTHNAVARQLHDPTAFLHVPLLLVEMLEGDWTAAIVYCYIGQRQGLQRYPTLVALSHLDIAVDLHISERTAQRATKKLVEKGLLYVERNQSAEHDYAPTNHYACNFRLEAEWMQGLAGG